MVVSTRYCSPDEVAGNAECLLGRVAEVQRVLRRKGFSVHAIDHAVTEVYRAAMPYVAGTRICLIENRRAWVFKVAIRAAEHAAVREVRCQLLEPAILAATLKDTGVREEPFDICHVLSRLTGQQSEAVQLCILDGKSHREAARCMGISVGTLSRHLSAGKKHLRDILAPHIAQSMSRYS